MQLLMTFPNSYIFKTVQDQISEIIACIEGKLKMPYLCVRSYWQFVVASLGPVIFSHVYML